MSKIESGYIKKELPKNVEKLGITLFVIGAVASLIGFIIDPVRGSYSYLVAFLFLLSISVGSLLLVAIEYASGATWSTPFRRISEFLASTLPLLIILVIPLFFSLHNLFNWTHTNIVAKDKILQLKSAYLNSSFFDVRVWVILFIWLFFYIFIIRNSRKQDISGNQLLTKRNITLSVIFIPVFAITITIQAIDWIMSLESKWFSTIFGVYLFAGIMCVALATTLYAAVLLKEHGFLPAKITDDHFYSLGTLLFAFISFWAYIAFSQYLLQWYGNLPEETFWFVQRWNGGWKIVSIIIIVGHFLIPFFALLSYKAKTNLKRLKFIAIWIMVMHFIDIYWLIMPSMENNGLHYSFSWMDISFLLAVIGLILFMFYKMVQKHNLIPINDPKLQRGLDFQLK
jgi:hypothetical protein